MDAATLRFVPEQALEPETRLSLTIDSERSRRERASNGGTRAGGFPVRGTAALVERLPAPARLEINPTSAVVATLTARLFPLAQIAERCACLR